MNTQQNDKRKNHDLKTAHVKNMVLKYLYNNIKLNTKFEDIANEKDLDNILHGNYIICPRFSGTRSWIMFFHVDNDYYAVNFPKHSQRKKQDLIIHAIDINVEKDFYNGTIMEGIFFRMDKNKYLVVDEVYKLAGENQLLKPKDDRLNYLSEYINKNTILNPNYRLFVSQYFKTDRDSLKELYQKIKEDNKIQEIIFYPKTYGRKIYNYTIIDSDLVDNIIKVSEFRMQKTHNPDVYNLLSVKSGNKIDIAYIPDLETSKRCKQWFKDNKAKELLVKCHMHTDKRKWIPMEIVEEDLSNDSEEEAKC